MSERRIVRGTQDGEVTDESAGRDANEKDDDAAGVDGRRAACSREQRAPVGEQLRVDAGNPGSAERDPVSGADFAGDFDVDGVAGERPLLAGRAGLRGERKNEGESEKRRERAAMRAESHRK